MRATAIGLVAALTIPLPVMAAETVPAAPYQLSVEEFLALVDGKTAHFSADGEYYGSEAYHPNRRSVWRDATRGCEEGVWRARGARMCFRYDSVSCWKVFRAEDGTHFAVSDEGLRVDFDRIEPGAFDCDGIPLG